MLDVQKWDATMLEEVCIWPWKLMEKKEPAVIFPENLDRDQPKAEPEIRAARALYLKRSDMETYGYTSGCPRCDHDMAYGYGRTSKGHSKACRDRIAAKLAETPAGRVRIAAASARMDNQLAEMVQRADQQSASQGESVVRPQPVAPAQ